MLEDKISSERFYPVARSRESAKYALCCHRRHRIFQPHHADAPPDVFHREAIHRIPLSDACVGLAALSGASLACPTPLPDMSLGNYPRTSPTRHRAIVRTGQYVVKY